MRCCFSIAFADCCEIILRLIERHMRRQREHIRVDHGIDDAAVGLKRFGSRPRCRCPTWPGPGGSQTGGLRSMSQNRK
jgi:hypothetical protein